MPQDNLKIQVDPNYPESIPDRLSSDSLQVDAGPTKYVMPGRQTMIKLTVRNFSSVGRMAVLSAQFNGNQISVDILPTTTVYVAPQGATAVCAIVRTYAYVGPAHIVFNVV